MKPISILFLINVVSRLFTPVITNFAAPPLWGWNFGGPNAIYDPGIPHPRSTDKIVYSSCGNDGDMYGSDVGFACPHLLMFSTDMVLAAKYDGLDENFIYAVVGSNTEYECGMCYQVQPFDPETTWNESLTKHQLIVQVVNSGFDVMPGHFDVFMAAGGFGFFTACNVDCPTNFCQGGPCYEGMYDTNFSVWNPIPNCYGGGVRVLNNKTTTDLWQTCKSLTGNSSTYKDKVLWQSCYESNKDLYHQNFVSVNALPIQCPDSLVRLTGLRRIDEKDYAVPHVDNNLTIQCRGSRQNKYFCMTTMQDCCMPSCAWMNKGKPDTVWSRVDSCKKDGTIWNY